MTATTHIRHMKDLDFTIMATVKDYCVEFNVYDIVGYGEGAVKGVFDVPLFAHDYTGVEDIAAADRFLHGRVKWDGCSDWHFDEQDKCMLHACDRKGLQRLGEVAARCWDWTAELLPNWDGD